MKMNVLEATREFDSVKTENIWNVLSHIYATKMGRNIFVKDEYHLVLMENKTDLPLITGDQPVVNTYAVGKPLTEHATDLEFYYPISPIWVFF